jgi:hypothetical protein
MSEALTIRIPRPVIEIEELGKDELGIRPSLGIDPGTGRVIVSLPPGIPGDGTMTARVTDIPIPVRCQRHAQWHAVGHKTVSPFDAAIATRPNAVHSLGIAAITMLAPAPADAERMAQDYERAWECLFAPIRKRLRSRTEDALAAMLDAACVLPAALTRATSLPAHEALQPLAEARFPGRSHPIWNSLEITPDTHVLPNPRRARARTSLAIHRVKIPGFDFSYVAYVGAVLAARTSSTCEEAASRMSAFDKALNTRSFLAPWDAHLKRAFGSGSGAALPQTAPARRSHPVHESARAYRAMAAAIRTVLLPGPDFALLALGEL